jgi:hypothetical protein
MDLLNCPGATPVDERHLASSALGRLTELMFAATHHSPHACMPIDSTRAPCSERVDEPDEGRPARPVPSASHDSAQAPRRFQDTTYELRIALNDMQPSIWRTFVVPPDIGLEELHLVVHVVMGWGQHRQHEFRQGRRRFGRPLTSDAEHNPVLDEFDYLLADLLQRPRQRLFYTSASACRWDHTITLIAERPGACPVPRVIAGEYACPPDDCGGPVGYATLLELVGDAATDDGSARMKWFQPWPAEGALMTSFPLIDINETLARGIDFLQDGAAGLLD